MFKIGSVTIGSSLPPSSSSLSITVEELAICFSRIMSKVDVAVIARQGLACRIRVYGGWRVRYSIRQTGSNGRIGGSIIYGFIPVSGALRRREVDVPGSLIPGRVTAIRSTPAPAVSEAILDLMISTRPFSEQFGLVQNFSPNFPRLRF
jgi:hypothetical protein